MRQQDIKGYGYATIVEILSCCLATRQIYEYAYRTQRKRRESK